MLGRFLELPYFPPLHSVHCVEKPSRHLAQGPAQDMLLVQLGLTDAGDTARCMPPGLMDAGDTAWCTLTDARDTAQCMPPGLTDAGDTAQCTPPGLRDARDTARSVLPGLTDTGGHSPVHTAGTHGRRGGHTGHGCNPPPFPPPEPSSTFSCPRPGWGTARQTHRPSNSNKSWNNCQAVRPRGGPTSVCTAVSPTSSHSARHSRLGE